MYTKGIDKMDAMKMLITAQQGELNAVILYKSLADLVNNEEDKKIMLSIVSDEGRHAAQLRKLTNKTFKPRKALKDLTLFSYKVFGRKITYLIMAKAEAGASKIYISLLSEYPQLKQISDDEARHSEALTHLVK